MKYQYFIVVFLLTFSLASSAMTVRLVIPGPTAPFTERNPFVEQLLKTIFAKQNMTLELVYAKESISQGRALKELNNNMIDLTWSVSTIAREQALTAVQIPIYKGFIGWRVFAINKKNQEKFSKIENLEALSKLLAVQRFDWPDYQIFIENNLSVDGNLSFSQMYKAVESGLADYLPRSVLEITRELEALALNNLAIEQTLLLKYPTNYYFFVAKNNQELAQTIKTGFELALADGSYQLLFQQHYGQALNVLNIKERKVLNLTNSLKPM